MFVNETVNLRLLTVVVANSKIQIREDQINNYCSSFESQVFSTSEKTNCVHYYEY